MRERLARIWQLYNILWICKFGMFIYIYIYIYHTFLWNWFSELVLRLNFVLREMNLYWITSNLFRISWNIIHYIAKWNKTFYSTSYLARACLKLRVSLLYCFSASSQLFGLRILPTVLKTFLDSFYA